MLNRILNWMPGVARRLKGRDPVAEPTPDMPTPDAIGEMWEAEGIPPARDPRAPWYQSLSVEELWKELSTSENANAALVTLKRPELNRGYFDGMVLIPEEEMQ